MICGMAALGCFIFSLIAGSGNSLIRTSEESFRRYTERPRKQAEIILYNAECEAWTGPRGYISFCETAGEAS